ncbi:MAG: 30S ribosomal protein S9 [Anaerolineae bacterium]|nr:30S ribosomal protein S9 [Anaerolineae bacterium]MCA9909715.1 30S ribosomal protein S9 [Anaerolineae bacterium]MCL4246646.1 30S ribosomal protein S9 [Anaerolineae bacterium]
MSAQYYEGIGRRKESSARVRLFPGGTGKFVINDKDANEYISREGDLDIILQPLRVLSQERAYDISVHVTGGGVTGQRDAIRLGIARALLKLDPEVKPTLRQYDLVTRDARVKERKKPGLKRARKAPTYTKR